MRPYLSELLRRGDPDSAWLRARYTVTYRELEYRVAELAGTYAAHGVGQDHIVAVRPAMNLTSLWTAFSLWSLGAQVVLVDPEVTTDEIITRAGAWQRVSFARRGTGFRSGAEVLVRRLDRATVRSDETLVLLTSDGARTGWTAQDLWSELRWRSRLPGAPSRDLPVPADDVATARGFVEQVLAATYAGACLDVTANHAVREVVPTAAIGA